MISRRRFVAIAGGAAIMSRVSWATEEVPSMLDHILLGCSDLDGGIAFVEQHTGVRAAIGGVHPGMGTRNALLSLGERRYLEIIAPDPEQKSVQGFAAERVKRLKGLTSPKPIEWAAHVDNIIELAKRLRAAGVEFDGPRPGSRKRPDGRLLTWQTLALAIDYHGLVPFFIEWGKTTMHPSMDAPKGLLLERFTVASAQPDDLTQLFGKLGLDVKVEKSVSPGLEVSLVGPKGKL